MPHIDFGRRSTPNGPLVVSWDQWFAMFEDARLALLYEHPATTAKTPFNKLLPRDHG